MKTAAGERLILTQGVLAQGIDNRGDWHPTYVPPGVVVQVLDIPKVEPDAQSNAAFVTFCPAGDATRKYKIAEQELRRHTKAVAAEHTAAHDLSCLASHLRRR